MKSKKQTLIIICIALLLFIVTFMDTGMIFRHTREQTRESGIYHLESISGRLEGTILEARNLTMELALGAREYIDDEDALRSYILEKKDELLKYDNGVFNVYVASSDFVFIPGFDMPDDYVATKRIWYTGAVRNNGRAYISSPYQDAMTGDVCYTVSVVLGDRDTVLAVDYTMENIQAYISQMHDLSILNAVIVTNEGIIAGCSDESLIGKSLTAEIPDYAGIWSVAKNTDTVATARIKSDPLYENLFATASVNDWCLIVSEDDWDLYKNSYIQLIVATSLSLALLIIVILLYLYSVHSSKKTEEALRSKEEFLNKITGDLKNPLSRIMEDSKASPDIGDDNRRFISIQESAGQLSDMIDQILSYSSIVKSEDNRNAAKIKGNAMNKRFRTVIVLFMTVVMLISLYTNSYVTYKWGNMRMEAAAKTYEFRLQEWINTQKSILDMFVSTVSTNPEMLDDYEGTVDYLNDITLQYPEISVTYMTGPELNPSVYMNNGWLPEEGWQLEERPWYRATMESGNGWSISAPYYDDQTGGYCITMSEVVTDANTGKFLGCFGIDFFMDKLVDILGGSYSETGYAFLADSEGNIINHPYGSYQMTLDSRTAVSSLPYGEITADEDTSKLFRDYDGVLKVMTASRNDISGFTVYVVSNALSIYGRVIVYSLISLITFLACIILVYKLLSDMIKWQDATNRQLKEAADTAIAAGHAKSRFLAQMSHEIRTPINAVLGMNEMILRESKDPEVLDHARDISDAGRNLLSIINSILDFSKIEDGKMEIVPVRYELSSMINNLVNSIAERARAKSLELHIDIDETLPSVLYGDDVRITQVIVNLLTNAVKYTEKGSVTLSMKKNRIEDKTVYLDVTVRDTGIGIKQEDMGKLFESFERLDVARNRNIEGTGLGMSIVTRLLLMMDSELKVDSIYGYGSTFSFTLKQTVVDPDPIGSYADRTKNDRSSSIEADGFTAGEARILVVDDNEMNLKVAGGLLKMYDIVPDMAFSGKEAIEMIGKSFYNIVFLDHMMPEMDGIETLDHLKKEKLLPESTVVIALTANAISGAKDLYFEAGFDDYLSKPIETAQLEALLKQYLPEGMIGSKASASAEEDSGRKTAAAMSAPDSQDFVMEFDPVDISEDSDNGSAGDEGSTDSALILDALDSCGINTGKGLAFCGSNRDFYIEVISDYASSVNDRLKELDAFYEAENWNDFETKIHALKSASATIGAEALSNRAKALETAARDNNISYINNFYPRFRDEYKKIQNSLTDILG
jgi:signal transduction histidine kinase/DNA-binding response OmpR family regulator/HPt (histidine-containing phosphotransfer) domain-containing protein